MNILQGLRNTYNNIVTPDSAITEIPGHAGFIMDENRTPVRRLASLGNDKVVRYLSQNPDLAGYHITIHRNYYRIITPDGNIYEIDLNFPGGLGYIAGYERMRQVVNLCLKYKVQVASFWGLSTDNIEKRPQAELQVIYEIIEKETARMAEEAQESGIRIEVVGNREKLAQLSSGDAPGSVLSALDSAVAQTSHNTGMTAAMVLAYGGRDEIHRASRASTLQVVQRPDFPHGASEEEMQAYIDRIVTEEQFASNVESHQKLGDLDILVRTGSRTGTVRTSGFFPYADYAEIYQFRGSWLDFREKEFRRMLIAYSGADRKFGGESSKNSA